MTSYFELEKPDLNKIDQDAMLDMLREQSGELSRLSGFMFQSPYKYWDKLKYTELPKKISPEEFWLLTKIIRKSQSKSTPIINQEGNSFVYAKLSNLEETLNAIDMRTGGSKFIRSKGPEEERNQVFIRRGILEEAIASSQLEGAHTTRRVAKKMLLEGRKPKNRSEMMIANNYEAIKAIEDDYKHREMDIDMIKELHRLITKGTLDSERDEGRMRTEGEQVFISDKVTGIVYHEGPPGDFVKKELEKLVDFANDKLTKEFTHPVLKAIMLHFWLGYLHPFIDGNGRLARLLFYWYLLRKGYWAFAYIPISKVIKKSPIQYGMAYVYTEQDDNDLTYFIDYHLRKIKQAINEFEEYTESKKNMNKDMGIKMKEKYSFNERQIMLLQYLNGDTDGQTTTSTHMELHKITKKTALRDLHKLKDFNFLTTIREGRRITYKGTNKINTLFG